MQADHFSFLSWFPGHVAQTKKKLYPLFQEGDLLLEVRDARAPLAFENRFFERVVPKKKRILLFNKMQLANPKANALWQEYWKKEGEAFLFTNFHDAKEISRIFKTVKNFQPKTTKKVALPTRVIVYGLPNTGKSTLINRLLRKNKLKIGPKPGVTRHLTWADLGEEIELLDSPGVIEAEIKNLKQAAYLALLHALEPQNLSLDHVINELFEAILQQKEALPKALVFTDKESLSSSLWEEGKFDLSSTPDQQTKFLLRTLQNFREGKLGKISLEFPPSKTL